MERIDLCFPTDSTMCGTQESSLPCVLRPAHCVLCPVCPVTHLPFFACQRALVLGCWQYSDSAYLHQICTVIVGAGGTCPLRPWSVLLSFHLLPLLYMSFARTRRRRRPRPRTFCQLCICANNLADQQQCVL